MDNESGDDEAEELREFNVIMIRLAKKGENDYTQSSCFNVVCHINKDYLITYLAYIVISFLYT